MDGVDGAAGMRFTDGFTAAGVTISGMPPVESLWVPLRPGLTVFYGVSGVGKTTVLDAVAAALSGVRPDRGQVTLHLVQTNGVLSRLGVSIMERVGMLRRGAIGGLASFIQGDQRLWDDPDMDEQDRLRVASTAADVSPASDSHHVELAVRAIVGEDIDVFHSPRVTLQAVGTADEPSWLVGLSAVPKSIAAVMERAESVLSKDLTVSGATLPELLRRKRWTDIDAAIRRHADDEGDAVIGEHWAALPAPIAIATLHPPDDTDVEGEDVRVWSVDRGRGCYRADDNIDIDHRTAAFLRDVCRTDDGEPNLIGLAGDGLFEPSKILTSAARWLSDGASQHLSDMTGQTVRLELALHDPNWWPERGLASWVATDPWGRPGPITELGSGLHRWAALAISLVFAGTGGGEPADVVLDEPERALHTAAQHQAAETIERLCRDGETHTNVFVASHSPAFLGLHDANVIRLDRNPAGHVTSAPLDAWGDADSISGHLGITRSDLLLATRWLILVEGDHDEAVIRTLFPDELRRARARIVVMGGADNATLSVTRGVLTYSMCNVRLVLDGLTDEHVGWWRQAVEHDRAGNQVQARKLLNRLAKADRREARQVGQAGHAALTQGQLQRIELIGLTRRDILSYLPVTHFVPDAASWDELHAAYSDATVPKERSGSGFKRWVNENRAITRINTAGVAAAAETFIGDAPDDLRAIVDGL